MNVSEDLVAMVERVRIFEEVTDANADQVTLEDTVKLVSIGNSLFSLSRHQK